MPENVPKLPQPASPVARFGAGDISERELSRERHTLQTTPPARVQPAHPKKQLFSVPVNKFTATSVSPGAGPNLARIRSCLADYESRATPARPAKIGPKAQSMEDLTPTKRIRRERSGLPVVRSPVPAAGLPSAGEEQAAAAAAAAAARICRFMLVCAWRRRREDVRCLRRTLEAQVSCSERLRIQVSALKSLLDSDNAKVRLAMRELDRLKQLLRDKEIERAVLEKEKLALENDVCAAEDRASEMSIGWRNCRNELEGARAAAAVCEHALSLERAAVAEARAQRDHAYKRLALIEDELAQHEELLSSAEAEVAALRREADDKQRLLQQAGEELSAEREARERCSRQCAALSARISVATNETTLLKGVVRELQGQVARLDAALRATRRQLELWPRPLTKMLGVVRSWFLYRMSVPDAVLWSLVPARHGC